MQESPIDQVIHTPEGYIYIYVYIYMYIYIYRVYRLFCLCVIVESMVYPIPGYSRYAFAVLRFFLDIVQRHILDNPEWDNP